MPLESNVRNVEPRIYDVPLSAGAAQEVVVRGSYVYCVSATGAAEVALEGGGFFAINPGQGWRDEHGWNRLTVRDRSGSANVVRLLIGSGAFVDNRVSGEVTVIDTGRLRAAAGSVFCGFVSVSPGAGNFGAVQLNNEGSTQRLIVSQITIQSGTVGDGFLGYMNVGAQATDAGLLRNKRAGAAGSAISRMRSGVSAAPFGGTPAHFSVALPALSTLVLRPAEPWVLPPNTRLTVTSATAATPIGCSFEVSEEPDT